MGREERNTRPHKTSGLEPVTTLGGDESEGLVSKRTGVQKASLRSTVIARGRSVSAESSLPRHTQGDLSQQKKSDGDDDDDDVLLMMMKSLRGDPVPYRGG